MIAPALWPDLEQVQTVVTAAQLTVDLMRRLIPDHRDLRAKLVQRYHEEVNRQEENDDRAQRLVEASRGYLNQRRQGDVYSNDYDIPIDLRANDGHTYFNGRLSPYDGGSFHITNSTIPYALLLKL